MKNCLAKKLSAAALTLVAASTNTMAQTGGASTEANWEVDVSYLSYTESDDRVSVSKSLASLTRRSEVSVLSVNLVNDTMSGASPTGAIRSSDSAVTFTGASGAAIAQGGDYSKSSFDDHRKQAGLGFERQHENGIALSYGAAVSREDDYDSYGGNIAIAKSTDDKLNTYRLGLAYTIDSIYRSDTKGTPEPLSNMQSQRAYSAGDRNTLEALFGYTRVINKRTLAQINLTVGQSEGYHSDPYKIISAADSNDRIMANFYDSRPDSRLRMSVFGKFVHQLRDRQDSIKTSYRYYRDDWGIGSHTVNVSYRYVVSPGQFIEPGVRLYRQSDANFYQRKLTVDEGANPILPTDGLASADYRLDSMTSATVGIKYGRSITPNTTLRVRAEYLDQRFSTADFQSLGAVIIQTSFSYSF